MTVDVRKGQGDVKLTREEFERRLRERFYDPEFEQVERQIADVIDVAWKAYDEYHKSPRTRKAGPGFANPDFELPVEWLETRERIQQAERQHEDASRRGRVLLVCGAARHDQTCPGEMSKTFRLASLAREESRARRRRVRLSRPESAHRAVRPSDSSLQGVRLHRDAALSLAVLVLSESRDGPGERLDERALSALGRGARRDDRHARVLVSGAERAEADDRSPRVRRRRQSGSDDDAREGREGGEGARARAAGTIPATSPAASSPSSSMAMPWARKRCADR